METDKLLEILNSANRYWSTGVLEAGITREALGRCLRELERKEVLLLKGVRRSGKSTLMAQMIRTLLEKKTNPRQILRVNLEEPLYASGYSLDLLERIYRVYREKVSPSGKCYLFLDEIQNIPGWERWVRGRGETENLKIVLTGSSSQLLSRETGAKLTGRQVSFEIFPLSFSEFLLFKGETVKSKEDYFARKPIIRNLLAEYRQYGGFPEVVLREEAEDKELLLKQYFEDILYRDVVSRHKIRDILTLQNLAVFLLTNIGRLTSVTNLKRNFDVSQDKVEHYTSALLESYLVSRIPKFEMSLKKSLRARFKPYAIDTGLRNRVAFTFSEDSGWLAENLVLHHLRQRHENIYYGSNGGEVDFLIKEGLRVARSIRVWHADPSETQIPARELAPFAVHSRVADSGESLLITNDLEQMEKVGKKEIRCLPLAVFLLGL
ncbi:MAG: ATP-binding protein [Deltaproteobacteria bacterium]|nr:ATP-binding protein [Deltaproteobacteria bacterium]